MVEKTIMMAASDILSSRDLTGSSSKRDATKDTSVDRLAEEAANVVEEESLPPLLYILLCHHHNLVVRRLHVDDGALLAERAPPRALDRVDDALRLVSRLRDRVIGRRLRPAGGGAPSREAPRAPASSPS